jgi:hypothetical protein
LDESNPPSGFWTEHAEIANKTTQRKIPPNLPHRTGRCIAEPLRDVSLLFLLSSPFSIDTTRHWLLGQA